MPRWATASRSPSATARAPTQRSWRCTGATSAAAADLAQETNRWLGPLFVAIAFASTSMAVVNTLVMIGLRRGRELARCG